MRRNILNHACLLAAFLVSVAPEAFAATGRVGPVIIERVSVVAIADSGHQQGNLEVKIKGGFALPSGVVCDPQYITTLRSVDVDAKLFVLATLAQVKQRAVYLQITDNPAYQAFNGRCSLIWIDVAE